jgi:dGTPase
MAEPERMPPDWVLQAGAAQTEAKRARVIADYIAGMTDRYAVTLYRRFFDDPTDLR